MQTQVSVPDTRLLFRIVYERLSELVASLEGDEWDAPTIAKAWRVRDILAQLLDGDIRRLSMGRDVYFGEKVPPIHGYGDLVNWLNQLNADWVKASRRISPKILAGLVEWVAPQVCEMFEQADPNQPALFPVAWAGEEASTMKFDIAREFTERWLHQEQIRHALGRPSLCDTDLFPVFIDIFLMGLPYRYREQPAQPGDKLRVHVAGGENVTRDLVFDAGAWVLCKADQRPARTKVSLPDQTAWQLFSKGITPAQARTSAKVEGDALLAEPLFHLVSVMA